MSRSEILDSDYYKRRGVDSHSSTDSTVEVHEEPEPGSIADNGSDSRFLSPRSAPHGAHSESEYVSADSIYWSGGTVPTSTYCSTGAELDPSMGSQSLLFGFIMVLSVILTRTAEPIAVAYSKTDNAFAYNVSVVVIAVEMVKFVFSAFALGIQVHITKDPHKRQQLTAFTWRQNLHYIAPSVLYAVANTLLFAILALINPGIYHVLANMKILTTGLLFRYMLGKMLDDLQWSALILLTLGTVMSMPEVRALGTFLASNIFYGFLLCLLQCVVSSLASVYIEMHFKRHRTQSIFFQNMQLYAYGIIVNCCYLIKDHEELSEKGMFYGWTGLVVLAMLVEASVGIALSFIFKFMDNIVYIFVMAGAMFTTALFSIWLFDFSIDMLFIIAMIIVSFSVYLYYRDIVVHFFASKSVSDKER